MDAIRLIPQILFSIHLEQGILQNKVDEEYRYVITNSVAFSLIDRANLTGDVGRTNHISLLPD